jgi:NADH-quinone oxidoreductase subunit A
VIAKDLGPQGFWAMMIFLGLFLLGDAYAWRKGAFNFK